MAALIALGQIEPLCSKFENKVEMYNSVTVLLLSYVLFCFTEFVPDAMTRY